MISKSHFICFYLFLETICKSTNPLRLAEILHGISHGALLRADQKQMQEVMDSTNISFFIVHWLEKEQVTTSGTHRLFFTAMMCDVNKYSKRVCAL